MEQIPLSWQLDEITWQLGGVVLLLAVAVSLFLTSQDLTIKERVVIWLLAAATVAAVSAETVAAIMTSWTAVIVVWLWLLPQKRTTYWLLLPLLGLWGAASLGQWPVWASGVLLATAVLQMGVWPFSGWRILGEELPAPLIILLYTYLPITGLALLARFPETSQIGQGYGLIVTALGLLGVLMGLRQTWSQLLNPTRAVAGLAQVQVNVALLAAVWGGREAAWAEAQVLLAIAVLYLAVGQVQAKWQLISPLLALAALAGLPLTAGFVGRVALYTVWWENGQILLVLVLALLHIPLITAGFWLMWPRTAVEAPSPLVLGTWFLPLLGLITLAGLGNAPFFVWPTVLLPFILGLIATRFGSELGEVRTILRRAFMFSWPHFLPRQLFSSSLTSLGLALREAARILEGESGLLWLLTFVVILLLVQ